MLTDLGKRTGHGAIRAALATGPVMTQSMAEWDNAGDRRARKTRPFSLLSLPMQETHDSKTDTRPE
ncbi:hypothetical protein ACROSR_07635 [Roseovarius tibetensis]|uniref:hypothetical protein n=1 Tax=Roseovarius tibetensis TaxID=2685897 RepID=UPI003D7F877B